MIFESAMVGNMKVIVKDKVLHTIVELRLHES